MGGARQPRGPTLPRSCLMLLTRSIVAACAVATLALAAGCAETGSGSPAPDARPALTDNGVATLPAATILSRAQTALTKAKSVHLKGNTVDEGQRVTLDVQSAERGGRGRITQGG